MGSFSGNFASESLSATRLSTRRPFVIVPVLSAQATSTRPSASIAERRRTTASRLARRLATPASPIRVRSGSPSGTPARAMVAPVASREARGLRHNHPEAMTMAPPATEMGRNRRSIWFKRTPSGLCCSSAIDKAAVVAPIRVWRPTATATARPVPVVTLLPSRIMRLASVSPSRALGTGSDSPVKAASSTSNPCELITRASATT